MDDILTIAVPVKNKAEIQLMKKAGGKVSFVMKELSKILKPGINTEQLDSFAEKLIRDIGCSPAFKGYKGFPGTLCVSINNEVVHGIPSRERFLKETDIVGIDVGVEYRGVYSDMAATFPIGIVSEEAQSLMAVTKGALYKGIAQALEGNRLGDISSAIQRYIEDRGFYVVKKFVGHGIGSKLHEEPEIPNYGSSGSGPLLKSGMTLALEPMVNELGDGVKILSDGWTVVTQNGGLSCHYEHTVLVGRDSAQVLTEF